MAENARPNPLITHVMGKIADREELERVKAQALLGICQRLDQVLDELRGLRPLVEELVERERARKN